MSSVRRSTLVLLAIGCGSASPTTVSALDAGAIADVVAAPPQINVSPIGDVFVTKGRSVSTTINVEAGLSVAIDVIDLPPGVAATTGHPDPNGAATIVVTAAVDAPQCDVAARAVAHDAAGVRGTVRLRIAVMNDDGSLDPAFGDGGIASQLPVGATFAGVAPTSDGHLLAASTQTNECSLIRLDADGTLDTSFAQVHLNAVEGFKTSTCGDLATDMDGNVALLVSSQLTTLATTLVRIDANGVVAPPVVLNAGSSVVWAGTQWIVFASNEVISVGTAVQSSTTIPFSLGTFQNGAVAKDGSVLLVGSLDQATPSVVKLVADSSGAYTIDTAFGHLGSTNLVGTHTATSAIADALGGFFVGVDGAIEHVAADGSYDGSFASNGALAFATTTVSAFAPLPSGDFIAFGDDGYELALMRFTSAGKRVASFGAFGLSATTALAGSYTSRFAYDGAAHLFVSESFGLARFLVSP